MTPAQTAIVLIGYQNDYFAADGILHQVVEESSRVTGVLDNTLYLLDELRATATRFVSTPIRFTADYSELSDPVGILATIKEVGAFQAVGWGGQTIAELAAYGDRIEEVPGKRGLNAFSNTALQHALQTSGITDLVLAGTVTSICIDSTARAAFELGYRVTVLADCTSSRTPLEQDFYCEQIFPLYAQVRTTADLVAELKSQPMIAVGNTEAVHS